MAALRKQDDPARTPPADRPGETDERAPAPAPGPVPAGTGAGEAAGSPVGALQARIVAAFSPDRRARTWRYGAATALTVGLALVVAGWLLHAQL